MTNLRLAMLPACGLWVLITACGGQQPGEIEGLVEHESEALSPSVASQLAYPELDLNVPVEYVWSHNASAANLEASMSEGFRLHSIEVLSGSPLRFTAALVNNVGVYARTGNDWAYDLTEAEFLAIYADTSRRIVDFARYEVGDDERFAAVWLDNTGSQFRDYQLVMNIDEFSLQFVAAGYRVMAIEPGATPPCGILGCAVSALMIPNTGLDAREQWFEAGTGDELEDRITTENIFCDGSTRPCRRLTDIHQAPDGFLFAVTEEAFAHELPIHSSQTPADHYYIRLDEGEQMFWAGNLTYLPGDTDNPDSLEHWKARTGSRFARLVPYPTGGETRYLATAVANSAVPVVDPFPTSNFVVDMVDDWITSQMRRDQVPGMSLAIARQGKLVYAKGFGYSDIGSLRQTDPRDLFRVASVSKMLAKAAIIRMQQDELHVSLSNQDFDIDLHPFGEIFAYDEPAHSPNLGDVTIRDLLNHKPGVAAADFGGLYTPADWIAKEQEKGAASFDYCPESFSGMGCEPATEAYTNANYYVLSAVFPAVSGLEFEDYLRETMLDSLNLDRIQVSEPTYGIPPAECALGEAPPPLPAGLFQAVNVARPEFYRGSAATYRGHEWLCPKERYPSATMAGSSIDLLRFAVSVNQQRPGVQLLNAESWVDMAATGVGKGVNKGGYFPEVGRAIVTQLTPDDNSGDIVYSWAMNSEDLGSFNEAELDDILRAYGPQLPDRDLFDEFIEPPSQVLSLDSADGWEIVSGTGTLSTSSVYAEGSGAIRVAGGNFIETRSPPVSTDEIKEQTGGAAPASIGLEVFIPTSQPNPYWIGAIQFYLAIPSATYPHNWIGQVQLTGLPRGRFVHIQVPIPAAQRSLLGGDYDDVRLYIAVNTPSNAPAVIVDHLQFAP